MIILRVILVGQTHHILVTALSEFQVSDEQMKLSYLNPLNN